MVLMMVYQICRGIRFIIINGDLVCSTIKGIYVFNKKSVRFEKYKGFGELYYQRTHKIRNIYIKEDNEYWIVAIDQGTNNEYIEKISVVKIEL